MTTSSSSSESAAIPGPIWSIIKPKVMRNLADWPNLPKWEIYRGASGATTLTVSLRRLIKRFAYSGAEDDEECSGCFEWGPELPIVTSCDSFNSQDQHNASSRRNSLNGLNTNSSNSNGKSKSDKGGSNTVTLSKETDVQENDDQNEEQENDPDLWRRVLVKSDKLIDFIIERSGGLGFLAPVSGKKLIIVAEPEHDLSCNYKELNEEDALSRVSLGCEDLRLIWVDESEDES